MNQNQLAVLSECDRAVAFVEELLAPDYLNDIEQKIVKHCFDRLTYLQISLRYGYSLEYVKNVGYYLWQRLSQKTGEHVTKASFCSFFRRCYLARLERIESKQKRAVVFVKPRHSPKRGSSNLSGGGLVSSDSSFLHVHQYLSCDLPRTVELVETAMTPDFSHPNLQSSSPNPNDSGTMTPSSSQTEPMAIASPPESQPSHQEVVASEYGSTPIEPISLEDRLLLALARIEELQNRVRILEQITYATAAISA